MLSAIWSVLQPFLVEIFKHKLDDHTKTNDWKRSALGKLMLLYNSLADLERSSFLLHEEFTDIALRNGAIARTLIRDRLHYYPLLPRSSLS